MDIPVTDPRNIAPIVNSPDWRQAVKDLLAFWIDQGRSFSSGEVAAALRIHRPDLKFSVPGLGESIRDEFYGNTLPSYLLSGSTPSYPCQIPRMAQGKFPVRTPSGTEVFVYAPDASAGAAHDCEIYVPEPGEHPSQFPAENTNAQPQPAAGSPAAVAILGAKIANIDIRAKVFEDGRLCIPRTAFELCVHLSGQPMQGGDPVFVKVETDKAIVTLTQTDPTAKQYDLSVERGRVLFPSPDATKPFKPGDVYKVTVDKGMVTVDLTTTA